MFDIGWSEMAIIMLLALIIIGPKDLPRVARTIGQWVRKGRMLAREFQTSLEDMARETELEDVKKEIEKVGRTDFKKTVENTIDPKGELAKAFDTSTDTDAKPALTDKSGETGKETPALSAANGRANGKASASDASPSVKPKVETATTAKKTAPRKTASAKAPAAKAKTTAKAKQPTAKKTAAAKKPVSSAKRSAKPATSTASPGAKRRSAKRAAGDPADEGGGADQTAVAAKPS